MPIPAFDEQSEMHLRTKFNEPVLRAGIDDLVQQASFSPKRIGPGFYEMMPRQRRQLVREAVAQGHKLLRQADPSTLKNSKLYFTLDTGRPVGFDPVRYIDVPAGVELLDPQGNLFVPDTSFTLPAHAAQHFTIAQSVQNPNTRRFSALMAMEAVEEMLIAQFLLGEFTRTDDGKTETPSFQLTSLDPTATPLQGLQPQAGQQQGMGVLLATPLAIAMLTQDKKNLKARFSADAKKGNRPLVMPVVARFDGLSFTRTPHPQLTKHVTAMGLSLT